MSPLRSPAPRSDRGAVLSFVLMVIAVLSSLAAAMSGLVRIDTMQQNAQESVARNFLAAEAGVNRGIAEYRNLFLALAPPNGSDFDPREFGFDGHRVQYQLSELRLPGQPYPRQLTLPAGNPFAGLNSILYSYSIRADDLHADDSSRAGLAAQFDVSNVPIFQFLFFYVNDLEFSYPAPMALNGRIHTNSDLYLNDSDGAGVFSVSAAPGPPVAPVQVSAARSIFRGESLAAGTCNGQVSIDNLPIPCNGGSTRQVPAAEAALWPGSLLVDIGPLTTPEPNAIAYGNGLYWTRADLRIVLDTTRSERLRDDLCATPYAVIEVQNVDGSRNAALTASLHRFMWERPGKVFYNARPTCADRTLACANAINSYVPPFQSAALLYRRADDANLSPDWSADDAKRCDYRRGGFFNNREKTNPFSNVGAVGPRGTWMQLLNIDLQALLDWNRAEAPGSRFFDPDETSDGGIVLFATVRGPGADGINPYGVRIFDSSDLGFPPGPLDATGQPDPTGITVASDQAIYVEGSFNAQDKTPVALMGDSINVISNAWEANGNDLKSAQGLCTRPGSDTLVNAAFLSGVDLSVPGNHNGGANNYPRLHEQWITTPGCPAIAQSTLFYRGSMVSLGIPAHVNGAFCGSGLGCDIYYPPLRNWNYDLDFNRAQNLPPLTPLVVWVDQNLFTQEFR